MIGRRELLTGTAVASGVLLADMAEAMNPNQRLVLMAEGACKSASGSWTRPADWPQLPSLGAQEFAGLYAVYNDGSNFIALSASGNYTVDWGDGSATVNYSAGATALYNYSYSASGLGPLTSEGYKTAIVKVTPQAGQNLTAFSLQVKHTQSGLGAYRPPWLDVTINGANLTSISIGGGIMTLGLLQRATIVTTGTITNFNSMFYACYSLQSIPLFNTAAGTNFSNMFNSCTSLGLATLSGTTYTISYSGCKLANTELIAILNALGTAAGAQTVTISGNWGDDGSGPLLTAIAAAVTKGWTVAS